MEGSNLVESLSYDIEIAEEDLSDYYIASVIWNFLEPTQTYRFFNATRTEITNQVSASNDLELFDTYQIALNNQVLNVETSSQDNYTLSILSADGKTLSQSNYTGNTSLDLGQINHQMILVNISSQNQQATKRFILH